MIRIGIDPGISGAIAIVDGQTVFLQACPLADKVGRFNQHDPREMFKILSMYGDMGAIACLESVHFDWRDDNKKGSAEALIRSHEAWKTALAIAGIQTQHLAPPVWRKRSGITTGQDKIAAVTEAIKRYPSVAGTLKRRSNRSNRGYVYADGMAEALLMADALLWDEVAA